MALWSFQSFTSFYETPTKLVYIAQRNSLITMSLVILVNRDLTGYENKKSS